MTWLGVWLCLMIAMSNIYVPEVSNPSSVLGVSPIVFEFPWELLLSQSLSLAPFSVIIHWYYTWSLLVVVKCGGREAFYNLMVSFQFFSGPMSLSYNIHKYFFISQSPPLGETGRLKGAGARRNALPQLGWDSGQVFNPRE